MDRYRRFCWGKWVWTPFITGGVTVVPLCKRQSDVLMKHASMRERGFLRLMH